MTDHRERECGCQEYHEISRRDFLSAAAGASAFAMFPAWLPKIVLAKSYAKVRVLLADPSRVVYEGSKFVHLARRITSHIEIRRVKSETRDNQSAFLIADDRALVYRLQASRWEGILEMNDPVVSRRYLNYFDEIWIASEPEAETRQQHL